MIKSCNSFSAGQLAMLREIEQRTGKPGGFIESDLVDPRYFSAREHQEPARVVLPDARPEARGSGTVKYTVGIDLGSTTTKAVVLGEEGAVLGRGITNSRSNYDVACQVALGEALVNARFSLIAGELEEAGFEAGRRGPRLAELERNFRAEQYRSQLRVLAREVSRFLG